MRFLISTSGLFFASSCWYALKSTFDTYWEFVCPRELSERPKELPDIFIHNSTINTVKLIIKVVSFKVKE